MLAAPTEKHGTTAADSSPAVVPESNHRQAQVLPSGGLVVSGLSRWNSVLHAGRFDAQNTAILGSNLDTDYHNFIKDMMHHRENVIAHNTELLSEFDGMWGINPQTGYFRSDKDKRTMFEKLYGGLVENVENVDNLIMKDLLSVRKRAAQEIAYFELPHLSNKSRGERLINLFQQDMLPGLSAQIVETSGSGKKLVTPVSYWKKALGWLVIVCMNAAMLFYVYLYAMTQPEEQQDAWFKSFIIWIIMDTIVVATLQVYVKNIVIPSYAMRDLHKIRQKLIDTIRESSSKSQQADVDSAEGKGKDGQLHAFSSADYFNVCTRVAQKFPHLRESKIILHFSTPWPKRSYQRQKDLSKNYHNRFANVGRSMGMVVGFLITNFIFSPSFFQDSMLQSTAILVFGYMMIGLATLYAYTPLLAVAVFIVVIVLIHYINRWRSHSADQLIASTKTKKTKLLPATVRPILPTDQDGSHDRRRKNHDVVLRSEDVNDDDSSSGDSNVEDENNWDIESAEEDNIYLDDLDAACIPNSPVGAQNMDSSELLEAMSVSIPSSKGRSLNERVKYESRKGGPVTDGQTKLLVERDRLPQNFTANLSCCVGRHADS